MGSPFPPPHSANRHHAHRGGAEIGELRGEKIIPSNTPEVEGRMTESPKRKWLGVVLVCVIGGCAYGVGLRAHHATTAQAIVAGAVIATISGSGIGLIVLFGHLIVLFHRRNYRFSLGALFVAMTLVAAVLVLAVHAIKK
jgi:hypothetical protein